MIEICGKICAVIAYAFLVMLYYRLMLKEKPEKSVQTPVSDVLIILMLWVYDESHGNSMFHAVCVLIALIMLVSNIANYVVINTISKSEVIREHEKQLEEQLEHQNENYERITSLYKKQQSLVHDHNKHLLFIKEAVNTEAYDDLKQYLEKMENEAAVEDKICLRQMNICSA